MATKKKTGQRRKRRTPEEMIEDLQKQISELKDRANARQLKQSPAVKAALAAVKALDKGAEAAREEENTELRHVLADAREPLANYLTGMGMALPKSRRPKGRRPAK